MQLGIHYFHICSKSNLSTQDETSYNLEWKEYQKRDHQSSRLHDTHAQQSPQVAPGRWIFHQRRRPSQCSPPSCLSPLSPQLLGCSAYSYSIVQDYIFSLEFISISNNISRTIHIFISSNPPQLQ